MTRLILRQDPPLHLGELQAHESLTRAAIAGFDREFGGPHMRQSHHELGRYENTWIARGALPELEPLFAAIRLAAVEILQRDRLRMAFWFNVMQPGDRTARHNHEEGNELLSGVYYLEAPPDCGDLLLYPPGDVRPIRPEVGKAVFFAPRLPHAVETNRSDQRRLSVAFNFGPAESS